MFSSTVVFSFGILQQFPVENTKQKYLGIITDSQGFRFFAQKYVSVSSLFAELIFNL